MTGNRYIYDRYCHSEFYCSCAATKILYSLRHYLELLDRRLLFCLRFYECVMLVDIGPDEIELQYQILSYEETLTPY